MSDRVRTPTVAETVDTRESAFEHLLAAHAETVSLTMTRRIDGVLVGTLVGFSADGAPLVTYSGQPGSLAVPAQSTLDLHGAHIGRSAVLMFDQGDPDRPIIMGCIQTPDRLSMAQAAGQVDVDADGERFVVSAKEQIVLRCGKASLTLTRDGKVLIQGAYLSSRSSGVLRLKAGSVQIN